MLGVPGSRVGLITKRSWVRVSLGAQFSAEPKRRNDRAAAIALGKRNAAELALRRRTRASAPT